MIRLALRSLSTLVVSALLGSLAIFLGLRIVGGDAANVILGQGATPRGLISLRHELGLDRPLPVQYANWLWGFVRGDLGTSYASHYDVAAEIKKRVLVTVPLVLIALVAASVTSIVLGTLGALNARNRRGVLIDVLSQVGITIPVFWLGVLLVGLVAVRWQLLPAGGFVPWADSPIDALRSLVLPAVTLYVPLAAVQIRYVRASMLEVLDADYIRTARARGRTVRSAAVVHGLRNASIPIVTVIGLQLGGLLAGAVLVEVVFNLPGLGQLLVTAVAGREVIVVQSLGLALLLVVLVLNFCTDLIYGLLDPRLRTGRAATARRTSEAVT
ncbi:MAG: peptide/nickel transport system permease protein [Solirubrobacteraceae bacterium]